MTLVLAGVFRVPPAQVEALRPHMLAVMAASRAEPGCREYAYAEDVAEPGMIRVFEVWTDQAALDAHFARPHMAAWQAAREAHGFHARDLCVYQVAGERKI
ncbi:putative quinol monooxygenase [Phenylobacterium sp.]|uniref:putative quinol monooxygenase n=1 Tax=Phenylobacterium sp. TaxID=1871053 RepID=UPI002F402F12